MNKLILVTGVTGKQGGAVARHLLKNGFQVRGLTRNPSSSASKTLAEAGVQIIQGDLERIESLKQAVVGCDGVFSVQNFWEKGVGYKGEIRQATNLVEAAKQANVSHFVQSSIAGCENAPGVKHFECKAVIEKIVRASGLPFTFLRTVMFMDNFIDEKSIQIALPLLRGGLPEDFKIHLLATDDIGATATVAFYKSNTYQNRTINLAGETLSVKDLAAIYELVTQKRAPRFTIPIWLTGIVLGDFKRQLIWNRGSNGWQFSVNEMRNTIGEPTTFEQLLRRKSKRYAEVMEIGNVRELNNSII